MLGKFYSIFELVVEFATDVWDYLNMSINDLISHLGLSVSVPLIGDLELIALVVSSVGVFLIYSLVKWVVGLF